MKRLIPKGPFFRGVAVIAGGTAFAQLLGVAASPVLSRIYQPEAFGVFSVFFSLLSILGILSSYKYEMAIVLPQDDYNAVILLILSMALVIFNGFLLLLAFILFGKKISYIFDFALYLPFFGLLILGFVFFGLYQALSYWSIREKDYSVLGKTRAKRSLYQIVTQIVLGFFNAGSVGLFIGHVMGEAGGISSLARSSLKHVRDSIQKASFHDVKEIAFRYRKFPYFMTWASLFNSAGVQVPPLLFASLYGPEVAGWFFFTQKVIAVPVSLVGRSVNQVFIGEATELARKDPLQLKKRFTKLNLQLLVIGLGPCLLLATMGETLFQWIFGAQWFQSGEYAQVMGLVFLLKLSSESVVNFAILERQELALVLAIFKVILFSGGIFIAFVQGYGHYYAVIFYSIAMILSYTSSYIIWYYQLVKNIHEFNSKSL